VGFIAISGALAPDKVQKRGMVATAIIDVVETHPLGIRYLTEYSRSSGLV